MERKKEETSSAGWLSWLTAVGGWLLCATMCLVLTIRLEGWPRAYEFVFPVVVAVLFSNILVFMFMASRCGAHAGKLFRAVCLVCLSEGALLLILYGWGRFFIAA
ncbi:hypothetical protein [uncultured Desulfovibrio sp.]|jgi:hypothetical protein|uniref:hypothetical protein n=1 Tax=uncultured Desulfovibrio sp. TaxID=167968 RepID=UPI0026109ADD|nr:hypothetical protein [uncultured Desulfovibrio sp.]